MTPTTAIQRAEQWRKENACGEAAKVAIALLNEIERLQINVAAYRNFTAEMIVSEIEEQPKNK